MLHDIKALTACSV